MLSISLTERINFPKFFNIIFDASREFNEKLHHFFALLANDQLFKDNLAIVTCNLMTSKIIPISLEAMRGSRVEQCSRITQFQCLLANCLGRRQIEDRIAAGWDWPAFTVEVLGYMKEMLSLGGNANSDFVPSFFNGFECLCEAARLQPGGAQRLFDLLFGSILATGTASGKRNGVNDTIIVSSFSRGGNQLQNPFLLTVFKVHFYKVMELFASNGELALDPMFAALDTGLDISQVFMIGKNEAGRSTEIGNDRFVFYLLKRDARADVSSLPDSSYRSFPRGASFFVEHPMYNALAFLFRNDDACRAKVAQFLSAKEYQRLRIMLGIVSLKSIVASVCVQQSLVPKDNEQLHNYVSLFARETMARFGIALHFPLLQLLVGVRCSAPYFGMTEFGLKEFFAFEMAREIGVFDEGNSEEAAEKMAFAFLYLSLLIVTERTLFHYDGYKLNREQIVFALKSGVSDVNKLKDLYDASSEFALNRIIAEVATPRKAASASLTAGEQDTSFDLKEGVEVNLISAVSPINAAKSIMNDEVTKSPDTPLKIPQFEPEETFFLCQKGGAGEEEEGENVIVSVKEFLFTPTVLAVVYKTLRDDSDTAKAGLNAHLAMDILILISKFIIESEHDGEEATFDATTVIEYDSTLSDLITQLRKAVFKYKVHMNKNASIRNTLTASSFDAFLNIGLRAGSEEPKSIVDILLEKGEIGKSALSQMSVVLLGGIGDEQARQDVSKMKKARALKLKESILSHYKNVSSSFSLADDSEAPQAGSEKDACAICSIEREKEILFYPLFVYRTKFPFIVDKPPLVKMTKRAALREADITQDSEFPPAEWLPDNEEEEEELPDPDEIMATVVSRVPDIDITSDLTEDEIAHRRFMLEMIHEKVMSDHRKRLAQREERARMRAAKREAAMRQMREEELRKESQLADPDAIVARHCTPGSLFVVQFSLCQHLVHSDCVHGDCFSCPIDRAYRNGLLPDIAGLPDSLAGSSELSAALDLFLGKYSLFFKSPSERVFDVFAELVKSISGLIVTYEVRLRSLPDCLDSKRSRLLSRNLFLAAWHGYRTRGRPKMLAGFKGAPEDAEPRMTAFQRFVKRLIECDEIESSAAQKEKALRAIVSSLAGDASLFSCSARRGEKELCLFLRRVCLADHFLLKSGDGGSKLVDWDDRLSCDSLSHLYGVRLAGEFAFRPFVFSPMPAEFLRFGSEPYNFPVDQTHQLVLFNVLDYNRMIAEYDDIGEGGDLCEPPVDYFNELVSGDEDKMKRLIVSNFSRRPYPSVVMFIGSSASKVAVVDGKRMKYLRPFYLDRYGCTDIGYQRMQPLFLSEERYERVMDQILAGEFSSGLDAF